MISTNNERKGV